MKKEVLLIISLIVAPSSALAQVLNYNNRSSSPQTYTYLDSSGRFAGDSVQIGNIVTFHDANGNMTGSGVTTSPLNTAPTRSSSPQTFTYLDSNGRFAGDSVQTGNIVTFHDANGNMTGSAVTTSPLADEVSSGDGDE
jgi:lipid-binding SYLF domain-containing protein